MPKAQGRVALHKCTLCADLQKRNKRTKWIWMDNPASIGYVDIDGTRQPMGQWGRQEREEGENQKAKIVVYSFAVQSYH